MVQLFRTMLTVAVAVIWPGVCPAQERSAGSAAPQTQSTSGVLNLTVQDEAGQRLPFRACIKDSNGRFVQPPGSPSTQRHEHGGPFADEYFYVDGNLSLSLPAGPAELTLAHGVEFLPAVEKVQVPASGEVRKTIILRRLVDATQRGWWSADEHLHRAAPPLMFQAEDINVAFTPICNTHFSRYTAGFPMKPNPDDHHLVGRCHAVEGNCFMWDLPSAISITAGGQPWPEKLEGERREWKKAPYVQPFIYRAAHAAGAMVVPYMHDTTRRLPGGYYPLYVAMGWIDAYGALENAMARAANTSAPRGPAEMESYMNVYYRFLNCGFRLPATAGSDLTAVGSSLWAGYNRFYARIDGPFNFQAWKQAVKTGRTFVSNQPLLFVSAEGQDPGAEFRLDSKAKKTLGVEIEALGITPIKQIQLIANGKVLQEVPVETPATRIRAKVGLDMPASGWFVVRCYGSGTNRNIGPPLTFAQTSPFYVIVDGQPARSPDDALFFRKMLAQRLEADLKIIEHPAIAEELKQMCQQALLKYAVE